jgi:hypothetical protein
LNAVLKSIKPAYLDVDLVKDSDGGIISLRWY